MLFALQRWLNNAGQLYTWIWCVKGMNLLSYVLIFSSVSLRVQLDVW